MANVEKEELKEEEVKQEQEPVSEEKSENSEKKEKPAKKKSKKKQKRKPIKPYVHIDTFLQTAVQMYELSNVQAQGFKSRMNGRHYQRDEKVFINELKKYLNLK